MPEKTISVAQLQRLATKELLHLLESGATIIQDGRKNIAVLMSYKQYCETQAIIRGATQMVQTMTGTSEWAINRPRNTQRLR